MAVEISAVNGRFTLDFPQTFSSSIFVNAFLKELEENEPYMTYRMSMNWGFPILNCPGWSESFRFAEPTRCIAADLEKLPLHSVQGMAL